jgi:hypothetical protein
LSVVVFVVLRFVGLVGRLAIVVVSVAVGVVANFAGHMTGSHMGTFKSRARNVSTIP